MCGALHGVQSPHRQAPQARSSAVGTMVLSGGGVLQGRASKTSSDQIVIHVLVLFLAGTRPSLIFLVDHNHPRK